MKSILSTNFKIRYCKLFIEQDFQSFYDQSKFEKNCSQCPMFNVQYPRKQNYIVKEVAVSFLQPHFFFFMNFLIA